MERENQSYEDLSILTESNVNENESIGLNSEDQSTISSVFLSSTRPPPPNYYYHHPSSVNSGIGLAFSLQQLYPPLAQIEITSPTMEVGLTFDSNSRDEGDQSNIDLDILDEEAKEDDGETLERPDDDDVDGVDHDDSSTIEDLTATTTTSNTPPLTTATTATLTTATTTLRPPPIPTTVDVPILAMSAPPHHPLPPPPPLPSTVPSTVTLPASIPVLPPNIVRLNNNNNIHPKIIDITVPYEPLTPIALNDDESSSMSMSVMTANQSPTNISRRNSSCNSNNNGNEYYCQICFETYDRHSQRGYELSNCRHVFCQECLVQFLKSKIDDGQVYPKCFHLSEIHTAPNPTTTITTPNPMLSTPRNSTSNNQNITFSEKRGSVDSLQRIEEGNNEGEREAEGEGSLQQRGNDGEEEEDNYEIINQQTIISHLCNEEISSIDIQLLLKGSEENRLLLEKYHRFKFCRENKHARECPTCHNYQIASPDVTPRITCNSCNTVYCYYHSNAHNFDQYPTCEAYEESISQETKLNIEFIQTFSKPCPHCGVMVQKTGGCNHMKCQCGTAFCWLCGKQIDDNLFPAHFQWWNPAGCSNLQMNEALEPTVTARVCARLLAIVQIVLLGPITLASTIASTLLCFSCICLRIKHATPTPPSSLLSSQARNEFMNVVSNCMSSWGIVWMVILVFLPLGIATGGLLLGVGISVVIVLYPCYALVRLSRREYPWPDWMTEAGRRTGELLRRCCYPCCRRCNDVNYWCRRQIARCSGSPPPSPPKPILLPPNRKWSRDPSMSDLFDQSSVLAESLEEGGAGDDVTGAAAWRNSNGRRKKKDAMVSFEDDVVGLEEGRKGAGEEKEGNEEGAGRKHADLIPDDYHSNPPPRMITEEDVKEFNTLLTILQTKIDFLEHLEAANNARTAANQTEGHVVGKESAIEVNEKEGEMTSLPLKSEGAFKAKRGVVEGEEEEEVKDLEGGGGTLVL